MKCWLISEYGSALYGQAKESDIGTNNVTEMIIPGVGIRNVHGTRLTRYWPGASIGSIAVHTPPGKTTGTYSGYRSTFHRPHLE